MAQESRSIKLIRNKLSLLEAHHFQRAVGDYLKVIFPGIQESTALGSLDNSGIDYVDWTETQPFEVVIQCKGFQVKDSEVGNDQVAQCSRSVKSFFESPFTTRRYILLLNRDVHSPEIHKKLEDEVARLVQTRKAEVAEVWYLRTLLHRIQAGAKERVRYSLQHDARTRWGNPEDWGKLGYQPIEEVPLRESVAVIGPNILQRFR